MSSAPIPAAGSAGMVRPLRLGEVLMGEVIDRLAAGELQPGQLLPTETELQAEFGVSRTALREGLKAVEDKGMIAIRQGRGAVVRPTRDWNVLDPRVLGALLDHHPTPEIYQQLNDVRMMLEPELARTAAETLTGADLALMEDQLRQMAGLVKRPEVFLDLDVRFHKVITDASSNLVARTIMATIEQPLRSSRRLTNSIPHALDRAHADHSRIFARLRDRDGDGAAEAMRAHLRWSADHLLRRWAKAKPATSRSTTAGPPPLTAVDRPGTAPSSSSVARWQAR